MIRLLNNMRYLDNARQGLLDFDNWKRLYAFDPKSGKHYQCVSIPRMLMALKSSKPLRFFQTKPAAGQPIAVFVKTTDYVQFGAAVGLADGIKIAGSCDDDDGVVKYGTASIELTGCWFPVEEGDDIYLMLVDLEGQAEVAEFKVSRHGKHIEIDASPVVRRASSGLWEFEILELEEEEGDDDERD